MFLLAGLGNPGPKYAHNRHNVGFMALDAIARAYRFPEFLSRHHAQLGKGRIGKEEVLLLKPDTFMNRSGIAVSEAARFYKIPPQKIWVFYDDMDLSPGKLRIKQGGSDGGHNGIKSIDAHLGKEYGRVRLGIGRPEHKGGVTSYVLGDFTPQEWSWVEKFLASLAEATPNLLEGHQDKMMNHVALAMQNPSETTKNATIRE